MTFLKGIYFKSFTKILLLKMLISIFFRGAFAQENPMILSEITELNCPKPMIWYTDSNVTTGMYCINKCCLPCPYLNNFYPDGELDEIYRTFAVFGIVSFFIMLLLVAWFLILPSQRNNQITKQILLPLVLSVCCFEFSEFFTLQQQKSQCANPVLRANISNNHYCAAQAFFTLGGAYAVASWAALLMLHLHLISVWRSEFIIRHIFYFNIYIWGTSFLAAIIPMSIGEVEANNICFIKYDYASIYYYFLSFIYVSFLAHLVTFSHMAKVTIKANWRISATGSTVNKRVSIVEAQRTFNHVKTIFALQWRALFGAILMLAVYVVNWSYFDVVSSSKVDSSLFSQWFRCLLDGGSQTSCAPETIPSLNWTIILLFSNRLLGILIFLILAAKKIVLVEVWNLLSGRIDLRSLSRNPTSIRRNISMSSVERGERLGRTNEAGIGVSRVREIVSPGFGSTSTVIEDEQSSLTSYSSSSMTSSGVSPSINMPPLVPVKRLSLATTSHPPPLTPARASFGLTPKSSLSIRLPLKHYSNRLSFPGEISDYSRRTSSDSPSHSGSAVGKVNASASSGNFTLKVNRTYERNKRRSRELARKITRNSISEISEGVEVLEDDRGTNNGNNSGGNDKMMERRTTFGGERSIKWTRSKDRHLSSLDP